MPTAVSSACSVHHQKPGPPLPIRPPPLRPPFCDIAMNLADMAATAKKSRPETMSLGDMSMAESKKLSVPATSTSNPPEAFKDAQWEVEEEEPQIESHPLCIGHWTHPHTHTHMHKRVDTHIQTRLCDRNGPEAYTHTKHDIKTSGDYITIRGTTLEGLLCAEGVLEV